MNLPNRKSVRLKGYDYSSNGAYFVTICTQNRQEIFGSVGVERAQPDANNPQPAMILNKMGRIVNQAIQETPNIRKNVQIDVYQIMPNHIHMVIVITDRRGVLHTPHKQGEFNSPLHSPSQTVGSIIRGIKSMTTKQIRIIMGNPQFMVWQRNFYEHVIRHEKDLDQISQYIMDNPLMWDKDRNNPANMGKGIQYFNY